VPTTAPQAALPGTYTEANMNNGQPLRSVGVAYEPNDRVITVEQANSDRITAMHISTRRSDLDMLKILYKTLGDAIEQRRHEAEQANG